MDHEEAQLGHCNSNVPKLAVSFETGRLWLMGPSFPARSLALPLCSCGDGSSSALLLGGVQRAAWNESRFISFTYTNAELLAAEHRWHLVC